MDMGLTDTFGDGLVHAQTTEGDHIHHVYYGANKAVSGEKWTLMDGKTLDRRDGPAIVDNDYGRELAMRLEHTDGAKSMAPTFRGDKLEGWYRNGKPYRADGDATETLFFNDGTTVRKWRNESGELHRVGGAATITTNTKGIDTEEEWVQHNMVYRPDGNAVIHRDPKTGDVISQREQTVAPENENTKRNRPHKTMDYERSSNEPTQEGAQLAAVVARKPPAPSSGP
jgi:hypothetical protein